MKVFIVDDSIVYRRATSIALEGSEGTEVVGTASNGDLAIKKIPEAKPDLVIVDMEMPVMDGLATIKELRKINKKVKILLFSAFSQQGAQVTMDCLAAGADDFLPKNAGGETVELALEALKRELVPKVLQFRENKLPEDAWQPSTPMPSRSQEEEKIVFPAPNYLDLLRLTPEVVCIGSSTGGPEALRNIFSSIKAETHWPILITQHMPPMFTAQLATMLGKLSPVKVKEAENLDRIQANHAYIAPGDYHMVVRRDNLGAYIELNQMEKENYVRPAVDPMFRTIAEVYRNRAMALILTGMGDDGMRGARALREMHSKVVIQDKKSSVVWGMPGACFRSGCFDAVMPLLEIGTFLSEINRKVAA